MWILFAFAGPVFWALSTHVDKYLVEKYFKDSDTAVLMVFTALIGLLMLPFIWFFDPRVIALDWISILVMAASGIFYMGAMLFYLQALQGEEASVIAPLFQSSVIFTFILAFIFLHETITWIQAFGVLLIIVAALALSGGFSLKRRKFKMRMLFLMLAATLVLALSTVIFKFFAVNDSFWGTTFWTFAGEALFGAAILAIPKYRKQFFELFRIHPGPMVTVNAANELINLAGALGVRFASLFAPVVIVSAIASTTTLFVFFFGILITLIMPKFGREDLSRKNLIQKGIAAALVAVAIVLINLTGASSY